MEMKAETMTTGVADTNDVDIKYVVNKENGLVICVLEKCSRIPEKRIKRYMGKRFKVPNYDRYKIRDTYRGVARCASDDTFDEEVGKKIALKKAKEKRARAINRAMNTFMKDIDKIRIDIERFGVSKY